MTNYQKMYHILFNAITDALRELEQGDTQNAMETLMTAQQTTEEIYMETADEL